MATKSTPRPWLAVTLAVMVIAVTGWFGFAGLFAGGLGENPGRLAFILGVYVLGSGLVGALLPRHWYLSMICAWGVAPPMLIAAIVGLISDHQERMAAADFRAIVIFITGVVIVPLGGLLFGYLGAAVRTGPKEVQVLFLVLIAAGLLLLLTHGIP